MLLFRDAAPREILARLLEGDPLELRRRSVERVRSQALLLDAGRLHLRTVAHVARHASAYRGAPPIDVWIAEKLRCSTSELLEEDAERAHSGEIPALRHGPLMEQIARTLGLEITTLALGLVAFHKAAHEVRSAFQGLVIDRRPLDAWCRTNDIAPDRAKAAVRRAFWALGVRREIDIDEFLADQGEEDGHDS